MLFGFFVAVVAIAGAIMTAIAGAGTGSTLVPLFALQYDFKLAVAAVAAPHLAATAVRTLQLRKEVDKGLFLRFGLVCAASSLVGALAQSWVSLPVITYGFAALLVIAGIIGLAGISERAQLGVRTAWIAGIASGFFGGLAGEQGGFRTVALLGFHLKKEAFVATSSAVGVLIDAVRLPVYWVQQGSQLGSVWMFVVVATAGTICGIILGDRLLRLVPQRVFGRLASGVILVIGILLFFHRS